ncbi:MAG: o-succinylbenzoate synthase [Verrucomicrobia bacterium]|jgi:O-succinylbenzoate synthase|nr:o-succinylbenzoate synthase [Verrucomicrobiota bacterium]
MNRSITVKRYERRFRQPLRTARGAWAVREGFLLRVERDGAVGYGEVAPLPEFGSETVAAAEAFLQELTNDPGRAVPEDLPCCAFALSAALRSGWGGTAMRSYAVSAFLPAGSAGLEKSGEKVAAGYRSLKWKIGVEPIREELRLAGELLKGLPSGVQLRLDANGGLTRTDLERWLDVLGKFPDKVDYLEQPLACGEEAVMAELSAASGVAIALDESLNGAHGGRWLEPGAWRGPLVIKAALMGGVEALASRLRPVADQVVLSSVFETGIGLESSLRVVDALPAAERPVGFDTVDAFGDALNPIDSKPKICEAVRRAYDPERIWNSI